jgi:hypothetical protein
VKYVPTTNGIDDLLFQNVNTGQVYEWQMNGLSVVAILCRLS